MAVGGVFIGRRVPRAACCKVRLGHRLGAQRHRALLPEMLTRPCSVVVIRDRSPTARRRWLQDTYAMAFRSRARGHRRQPMR